MSPASPHSADSPGSTGPRPAGPRPHAVWFRQDLRVHDHRPLLQAASRAERDGAPLHCVYVMNPREFEASPHLGLRRTGPFRARFLLESLTALRKALRKLGSELVIRRGDPAEVLCQLAREENWASLGFHELVGTEERSLERRIRKSVTDAAVTAYWDRTLHDDYPFELHDTPEVFSRFRKLVEKSAEVALPETPPPALPGAGSIEAGDLPDLEELGAADCGNDARAVHPFPGGEEAALERLRTFVWDDHIRTYKETRNGLIGADYSSKLSPWLALGCLSCRQVQREVTAYEVERGANDSTYWVFFELLWRDYFQLIVQKHRGRVFRPSGLQGIDVPWRRGGQRGVANDFDAWRLGKTGFPFVDGHMRELLHTGFMSNRGRQNVGSFLTKNLGIDWRLGAEWFEVQLIDHDVASNYGNWNYTAGVGNDARGFRYFNIPKQARVYDPEGLHAKLWIDELGTPEYPEPMVDLDRSADQQRRGWEKAVQR